MSEVRGKSDPGKLGFYGGVIPIGKTPEEGVMAKIKEKTGLNIVVTEENLVGTDSHFHFYKGNGDRALFYCSLYAVELDAIPEFEGFELVKTVDDRILSHQQPKVQMLLDKIR